MLVLATLALAVAGAFAVPAAHAADAAITLQVAAGIDGQYLPGHPMPVTVTVTSDRLVRGQLVVKALQQFGPTSQFTSRVPVEVPAGSAKAITVVLPTQNLFGAPGQLGIEATLTDGGNTLATGNGAVANDIDREVVGLLGSLAEDKTVPKSATPRVPIGAVSLVAVADDLAAQPGALDPADQLAVTAADLGRLADGTRGNVLDWVAGGGQLLVVDDTGDALTSLPAAWQPAPGTGRTVAALGTVRRLASANWWKDLEPTQARSGGEDWLSQMKGFGGISIAPSVAREAGLKVARIAWLGAFLGAYVVLVGLVLPIVLRRTGRSGLLWVAVPIAALLFTSGAWVAGRSLRAKTATGHVTVLDTTAASTRADTWIGAVSRGGGSFGVDLPAGWSGGDQSMQFSSDTFSVSQQLTNRGQRISVALAAGQFGMVQASGRTDVQGALDVRATSNGNGTAHVTVTNRLPYGLEQLGVVVDAGLGTIDRLAAGETHELDITATDSASANGGGRLTWAAIWPDASGMFGPPVADGVAAPGAIDEVSRRLGSTWAPPGVVRVIGWTHDAPSPLVAAKGAAPRGRTAVTTSAPVLPATAGAVNDVTVLRRILRGPNFNGGDITQQQLVLAYDLPAGAGGIDAAQLRVRRPAGTGIVEVLVGSAWVALTDVAGAYTPSTPPAEQGGFNKFPQGQVFGNRGDVVAVTIAVALPATTAAPVGPGGPSALPDGSPAPAPAAAPGANDNVELRLPAGALDRGRVYLRLAAQNPFAASGVYVVSA